VSAYRPGCPCAAPLKAIDVERSYCTKCGKEYVLAQSTHIAPPESYTDEQKPETD
jgi:hypothetical protein